MHQEFPDWYRLCSAEPTVELLQQRWAGVEGAVAAANRKLVFTMVQLYFARSTDPEETRRLQQAFKTTDEAFPLRGNDLELQVLAGATLVALLDGKASALTDSLALIMRCAAFGEKALPEAVPTLPNLAELRLQERSLAVRQVSSKVATLSAKKVEVETAETDPAGLITSVQSALDKLQSGTLASMQKALDTMMNGQRAFKEEVDALWWVVGEYSGDLQMPFSKVNAAALPLVAAKELADHTSFTPGFMAADAMLVKVLAGNKPNTNVTIKRAVDDSERVWREDMNEEFAGVILADACPIMLAVLKSLETEDAESWAPVYEKAGRVDLQTKHARSSIARQFYNEVILIRSIEEL